MAITDNTFTADELTASIGANAELQTVLLSYLTGKNFTVKPQADYKKELASGISSEVSKIAGRMESDVLEHFKDLGVTKSHAEEKYYDLFKRGATAAKDKIANLQTELSDLRKKIADGKGDEELKNRLQLLQTQVSQYETQIKNYREVVVPEFEKRINDVRIGNVIDAARRGIAWRKDIPSSIMNNALDFERDALLSSAKHVDGVLTFYDKSGTPLLDDKGNIASAEWLIRKKFADSIETEATPGAGTKPPRGTGHKHPATGQEILVPTDLKTKTELVDYLTVKLALSPTSKEVMEITKASQLPLF